MHINHTLRIGDICPQIPVIQGGMGVGISLSGLASAVAIGTAGQTDKII